MDCRAKKTAPELRVMLVGMAGDHKASVMNILQRSSENQEPAAEADNTPLCDTEKCHKVTMTIGEQTMVVVNTPDLRYQDNSEMMKEVKNGVSLVAPGPHMLLFVLPLGPFTEEVQDTVQLLKTTFGENLMKHMMVLFPKGENLGTKTIDEFISENEDLKKFVDGCKKRYHVLQSDDGLPQVTKLVKEIQDMVKKNGGDFYVDVQARKRRIALSINGAAVVGAGVGGAGVGGAVSHLVGGPIGWVGGVGVGAVVGGVVGLLGIVAVERHKLQKCVLQ